MKTKVLWVCIVGLGLLTIASATRTADPEPQQDVIRLETRINQLEQRVYSLDSNLRNLDQQVRLAISSGRSSTGGEEVARLRLELQALQQRLEEHECALSKLDERTLSTAMRAARRKSGPGSNDPCRLNVDTPVQFSSTRDD